MDVRIDYLSSPSSRSKCSTFYECTNNNEMSTSADENNVELHSQKPSSPSHERMEKAEMEIADSYFPKNNKTNDVEKTENVLGNKLNYIQDILKETKTSNVNVLVKETEANNEICFDSEKFPKKERRRNIAETNYYDIYANDTNVIQKDPGSYFDSESNFDDNLDLKRIKVNHLTKEKVSCKFYLFGFR